MSTETTNEHADILLPLSSGRLAGHNLQGITPTPWAVASHDKSVVTGPRLSIDGSGRQTGTFHVAECTGYMKEREANAGFIVRACNAHDDLLAALNDLCDLPADDEGNRTIPAGMLDAARAAINKATAHA